MPQYYRVKIDDKGKVSLVDDDYRELPNQVSNEIMIGLRDTYITGCLYLMYSSNSHLYKIGYTTQVPEIRLSQVRREYEDDSITLEHTLAIKSVSDGYHMETTLQETFCEERAYGEWFRLDVQDVAWIEHLPQNLHWFELTIASLVYMAKSLTKAERDVLVVRLRRLADAIDNLE